MAQAIRDKAYYDKTTHGSHTSGRLAEAAVYQVFDLREPYVEVKACQKRHLRVVIKKSQVDIWPFKTYVVVVYDRDYARLSFEQAFENQLMFLFLTGAELMKVVKKHDANLRTCYSQKLQKVTHQHYEIRYQWIIDYLVKRDGLLFAKNTVEGHEVYGEIPPPEKQKQLF